jgi:hypothetical protein
MFAASRWLQTKHLAPPFFIPYPQSQNSAAIQLFGLR